MIEGDLDEIPANGVQAVEQQEEVTEGVPLEVAPEENNEMKENQLDLNLEECQEIVPELESPPPPSVTNVQTATAIHSTLKVKESPQSLVRNYFQFSSNNFITTHK